VIAVRPSVSADIPALQGIAEDAGLFPPEMLPELITPFLLSEGEGVAWLTAELNGEVVGLCYAVAEQFADRVWNMLALGVLSSNRSAGVGIELVRRLELDLQMSGQRILIVETSSSDAFSKARAFYSRAGYAEEARIRDFWAEGDDKIVFWKALQQAK
jgi:ribosomal protein S18 acetylase RimI-like enzyme